MVLLPVLRSEVVLSVQDKVVLHISGIFLNLLSFLTRNYSKMPCLKMVPVRGIFRCVYDRLQFFFFYRIRLIFSAAEAAFHIFNYFIFNHVHLPLRIIVLTSSPQTQYSFRYYYGALKDIIKIIEFFRAILIIKGVCHKVLCKSPGHMR